MAMSLRRRFRKLCCSHTSREAKVGQRWRARPRRAQIESEDVRELLHELSKPRIRIALIVFELYAVGVPVDEEEEPDDEAPELEGDSEAVKQEDVNVYSMRNFLHFTENDGEGVVFRYHWFVRCRLEYLSALEQADEGDERLAMLYAYVEAHAGAFEDTDVLALVHVVFRSAHKYFEEHTDFLFLHPVDLSFGMLMDEMGDGVRTAQQLVSQPRQRAESDAPSYAHILCDAGVLTDYFNTETRTNFDSLGRPPLYSPSLACRVVHIKPRYSSNYYTPRQRRSLFRLFRSLHYSKPKGEPVL